MKLFGKNMENKITKFALIADPHYYSEKLGISGSAYQKEENVNQKMLKESRAVISAALEQIKNSDVEFLLVAGDLANDGERVSHEEMRELLSEFKKTKPVYVITATHDWCCSGRARKYDGDNVSFDVPVLSPEELDDFYVDLGFGDAISKFTTHQGKISYAIRPVEKVTVLCLDDDQDGNGSSGYSPEHWDWIRAQIKEAKERGDIVFGMQHHHLMLTEFMRVINGKGSVEHRKDIVKNFMDSGLSVLFTGHSHMQSIRKVEDGDKHFYEINAGSVGGHPATILYCDVYEDGIDVKSEFLQKFTYNGKEYTNDYLKKKAVFLIENLINAGKNNEKEKFVNLLLSIGMKEDLVNKLWLPCKIVLKRLSKLTIKKAARIMNFISFGKAIDKKAAKEVGDTMVTDFIYNTFLSILDGSIECYEEGTAYYTVFTQALAFPVRFLKKLHIKGSIIDTLTHLKNAGPELATGGPLNNHNWFCEF